MLALYQKRLRGSRVAQKRQACSPYGRRMPVREPNRFARQSPSPEVTLTTYAVRNGRTTHTLSRAALAEYCPEQAKPL
jgi:hypothetical protein